MMEKKKGKKFNERTRLIFDVLPVIWGAVWFRRRGLLVKSSDTHWILSQVRLNLLPAVDKWLWSALDGESKAGRVGCSPTSSWSEEPPQLPLSAFKLKARTGKPLISGRVSVKVQTHVCVILISNVGISIILSLGEKFQRLLSVCPRD